MAPSEFALMRCSRAKRDVQHADVALHDETWSAHLWRADHERVVDEYATTRDFPPGVPLMLHR
jgi:hypothetical protein